MFKSILTRLKLAFDAFVRAHIVDDAENLWPDMTAEELIAAERR